MLQFPAAITLCLGACLSQLEKELSEGEPWAIALLTILCFLVVSLVVLIVLQPVSSTKLSFHVSIKKNKIVVYIYHLF